MLLVVTHIIMSQPATEKRQRSPAQVLAFEKAKATREANLRRKWEEEQAAVTASSVEDVEESSVDASEEVEQEYAEPPKPKPHQQQQQVTELNVPAQQHEDYIELDTDDLFAQLNQYKNDIAELRGHVSGLRDSHQQMQSSYNSSVPHNFFV
jgi:hypothetical protein